MSHATTAKGLRERLTTGTEDRLGRALTDLLENPILTGAIGRAFDARERAAQAQELAMGALNLPSAADIERLTRRLRSLSQRLEGIEDGVDRLDRTLSVKAAGVAPAVDARLGAIEQQLETLTKAVDHIREPAADRAARGSRAARASGDMRESAADRAARGSRAAPSSPKKPAKPRAAPKAPARRKG
jgi:hypothetical protein